MQTKKVLVCPKCGSRDIDWHMKGRDGFRECRACGHIGNFNEETVDDQGDEIWP